MNWILDDLEFKINRNFCLIQQMKHEATLLGWLYTSTKIGSMNSNPSRHFRTTPQTQREPHSLNRTHRQKNTHAPSALELCKIIISLPAGEIQFVFRFRKHFAVQIDLTSLVSARGSHHHYYTLSPAVRTSLEPWVVTIWEAHTHTHRLTISSPLDDARTDDGRL